MKANIFWTYKHYGINITALILQRTEDESISKCQNDNSMN